MSEPLWEPSAERVAAARLTAFIEQVNRDFGLGVAGYQALYDWSISEIGDFWRAVWDFGAVIAETRGEVAIADGDKMPGARFFPDARLNFAENLLRNASAVGRQDASGGGGETPPLARSPWTTTTPSSSGAKMRSADASAMTSSTTASRACPGR